MAAQPRDVAEQALVRCLAKCQVEPHLVGRPFQALAERRHVLRQQRGRAGSSERQPDIGAGDDLLREPGEPLTHLGAEHQPTELVHHALERPGLSPRLFGKRRSHGADDPRGERIAQGRPDGQGLLDPLDPVPSFDRGNPRGKVGHAVEPDVCQLDRFGHRRRLAARHGPVVAGERRDRDLASQVPVDRPTRPGKEFLQLGEQRDLAGDVVGIPPLGVARAESEWQIATHVTHGSADERDTRMVPRSPATALRQERTAMRA